jgi:hypothetical protein
LILPPNDRGLIDFFVFGVASFEAAVLHRV